MRYDTLVLDTEELLRDFRYGLSEIDEDEVDSVFTDETISFILDYIADQDTAKSSLDEHIRTTVEFYQHFDQEKQARFKSILEAFCHGFLNMVIEADAYIFGVFRAIHDGELGDSIILRKMTQEESNEIYPSRSTHS